MNKIRLIPRLDVKGPNLIKGIQLEGLRVVGDPYMFAEKYYKEAISIPMFPTLKDKEQKIVVDAITKVIKE